MDNKGGANYRGQLRLLLAPFFAAGLNTSEICIFLGFLTSVFCQLYATMRCRSSSAHALSNAL